MAIERLCSKLCFGVHCMSFYSRHFRWEIRYPADFYVQTWAPRQLRMVSKYLTTGGFSSGMGRGCAISGFLTVWPQPSNHSWEPVEGQAICSVPNRNHSLHLVDLSFYPTPRRVSHMMSLRQISNVWLIVVINFLSVTFKLCNWLILDVHGCSLNSWTKRFPSLM